MRSSSVLSQLRWSRWGRVRASAIALASLLLVPACDSPGPPTSPRNVLLVSLDTLRADRLGSYGYESAETPRLDALAARGARFERAATVVPLTLPAHASLMTGTFPPFHGVRDNGGFYLDEELETLAEVLSADGFRTAGFVAAFVLDSRWGIAQGFEHFHDDFDLTEFEGAGGMDAIQRPGAEVVDEALRWLGEDTSAPFFAWIHLYDPHTPYEAPEPYRSRFPATRSGAYDAEIAATDAQVGRLLAALEASGQLEETLVVVVGDHGEMLGEHDEPTHGFFLYEPAVRIPLILAGPGIAAIVVEQQVRIVDVMPTVLGRLGLPMPAEVQGADLAPLMAGASSEPLYAYSESWHPRYHYGWSDLAAIQHGRYKLIGAPRPELYDLEEDPGELDNRSARDPDRLRDMSAALDRMREAITGSRAGSGPVAVDAETADRLAALGYLASSPGSRHLDERPRADPKDKIGLYNLLKASTAAAVSGDLAVGLELVERALSEDAEVLEAHLLHGNYLRKSDRTVEAVEAYRRALALDDEHHEALYSLALAYKDLDQLDDALLGLERAAELDPRNGKVIWQLADVEMRRGRFDVARARLEGALALDLDRPRFLAKLGECHLETGRFGEAEARLRQALADNPKLARAHFHLGLLLEEQGRPAEAIEAYRQELEVSPEAYRAAFNLGKLLAKARRPMQAAESFARSVELQPAFGTGWLYLAKARLDTGRLAEAQEAAEEGLANEPDPRIEPLGHYVLADVANRRGDPGAAERHVAAARRLERALGTRDPSPAPQSN